MKMPKLPDSVYNWLKWISIIALPLFSTFLSTILSALSVDPNTIRIIRTILDATAVLIGGLIGVSTIRYNHEKDEANKIFEQQNITNGDTK